MCNMSANIRKREYDKRYHTTDDGRDSVRRYRESAKGIESIKRYTSSTKGIKAGRTQRIKDRTISDNARNKSQAYTESDKRLIITKLHNGNPVTDAAVAELLGRTHAGIVSKRSDLIKLGEV